MSWPEDWDARIKGDVCAFCREGRPDDPPRGPRIFASRNCDAYLARAGVQRGWATVIWRKNHIVDPGELSQSEANEFWGDILRVGRAMQAHFRPLKLNYSILGNRSPHLHAIVAARFIDDVAPGVPLPGTAGRPFPASEIDQDARALRGLLAEP